MAALAAPRRPIGHSAQVHRWRRRANAPPRGAFHISRRLTVARRAVAPESASFHGPAAVFSDRSVGALPDIHTEQTTVYFYKGGKGVRKMGRNAFQRLSFTRAEGKEH